MPFAATTRRRFQHDGIADLRRHLLRLLRRLQAREVPGTNGTPAFSISWRARVFDPIISIEAALGPMNLTPALGTGLGKFRILRKKSVAGMNRVRAAAFCDVKDLDDIEIGLGRGCGANGVGFIGHQNVQRSAIHIGKDRNRGNPQLAAGANHPHRDLPPIRDENLLEHECMWRERPARAAAAWTWPCSKALFLTRRAIYFAAAAGRRALR